MRTKLTIITALLLAALLPLTASANEIDKILSGDPAGKYVSAVDTNVAMVCRFIGGDSGGGEITVAAGGDITLTVATVADDTTECPISGAYGGVIDVSDASCDTMGEVVDAINFGDNWRCHLVGALRTDSSNDTLLAMAISTADSADGRVLYWDTSVNLHITHLISPSYSIRAFTNNDSTTSPLFNNPFKDSRSALHYFSGTVTTTGAATITIYSVKENNVPSTINTAGTGFDGSSETVTTLLSIPGGATTVEKVLDFSEWPMLSGKGEKLLVRESATTDLTVPLISAWGTQYQFR